MLLELPQDIHSASSEILFPADDPVGIISPAKNGVLVYGTNGKLAGQAFLIKKGIMRISIGDGGSVDVKKEGHTISICPSPLLEAQRRNTTNFFIFGDPSALQYKLFIKKEGVVEPVEAAVVAKHFFRSTCFIKINESAENPFRLLLICLCINLL